MTGAGPDDTAVTMPAAATAAAAATPSVTFRDGRRVKRLGMLGMRNRDFGKVKRGVKVCLRSGAGERSSVTQEAAGRRMLTMHLAAAGGTRMCAGQGDTLLGATITRLGAVCYSL